MKKLILAVAVFACAGSFAVAQSTDSIYQTDGTLLVASVVQDDYKEVGMDDLNENVQTAIKALEEANEVKKIEYDATSKQVRVTLEDKATKSEKIIVLDDEGKEVM
jgi:23S rRNA pseudoU1915 N3-methylase RlmH